MTADSQHGGQDSSADAGRKIPTLDSARNLMDLLLMRDTAGERKRLAACHKVNGVWKELTWGDQILRIRRIAAGLLKQGVKKGDKVAIFADTRLEWIISALAIFAVGASVVPVYGSDTPAEIAYILENSSAVAMIIDHDAPDTRHKMPGRLARLREVWPKLPELKSVILMDPPADPSGISILADIELQGAKAMESSADFNNLIERAAAETAPDDIAFLLYTSGTTGAPKGVMLTHSNWTSQARDVSRIGLVTPDERILLFLPLAHAFALIAMAAHLSMGLCIAYAESIDKAIANAGETNTSLMICVPRVLEKAYNKVVSDGSTQPGIKGQLFRWAMIQFEEYATDVIAGREHKSLQWSMAKKLVFSQVQNKIRARFGTMKKFVSGGAPLSKKIAIFFDLCGFKICEGYGLTETCAPTHCNLPIPGKLKLGTVGLAWPGVLVRTAEDGEILLKGPQIMKGYYKMPEATAAAIDPDGWFHTGDIGEVDTEDVVQVYAQNTGSGNAPLNPRLVAFKRVALKAGETASVVLDVYGDDLMVIDKKGNRVSEGRTVLYAGTCQPDAYSRSLTGTDTIKMEVN